MDSFYAATVSENENEKIIENHVKKQEYEYNKVYRLRQYRRTNMFLWIDISIKLIQHLTFVYNERNGALVPKVSRKSVKATKEP